MILNFLTFQVTGTLVIVNSTCEEGHLHIWLTQPEMRHFATGNVELTAAILFTGSSPAQSVRLLQNAGIVSHHKEVLSSTKEDFVSCGEDGNNIYRL